MNIGSKIDMSVIVARAMSYLMMLGDSVKTRKAIKQLKLPIKPINWYDNNLL